MNPSEVLVLGRVVDIGCVQPSCHGWQSMERESSRDIDGDALWFQNIPLSRWENQNLVKISNFREQKLVFYFFAFNGL